MLSGVIDMPWGFQVSPILQLASARPYSILPSCGLCDINRDGVANDRETRDGNDQNQLPPAHRARRQLQTGQCPRVEVLQLHREEEARPLLRGVQPLQHANFGNQFQNVVGTDDFKLPVNFFGATGFSEPIGIPFQAQFGFRFNF